jgi:hypothetical protein
MAAPLTGDLIDLAADDVIVEPFLSSDEYGNRTYGPPATYRCRVLGRSKLVLDPDGQEKLSGATVIFFGEYGLSTSDRYTLPARFSADQLDPSNLPARQPQALNIDRETDENGAHHTTVYFSVARLRGY